MTRQWMLLLGVMVSLHAFGYYYANQLQVGPAMTPYMNSTTYGGYADIRFSSAFGTNLGVRRYVDPMTGQWTTTPIINPYIKIGSGRLELMDEYRASYYIISGHTQKHFAGSSHIWYERLKIITLPRKLVISEI